MLAIFLALIAFVGWGVGDVFSAVGSRKIGAYSLVFWTSIYGLIFTTLYAPFAQNIFLNLSPEILLFNVLIVLLTASSWYLFNKALIIGNPTIVGTIAASFPAFVVILSLIFFKETITRGQIIAVMIIFAGIILTSLDLRIFKKGFKIDRGIILAFITMMVWSIYFTFVRIPIEEYGWYLTSLVFYVVSSIFYLIVVKLRKIKIVHPIKNKGFKPLLISSLFLVVATFGINSALSLGQSSIVAPIAGSYPALFAVVSYMVFKEKISKQQIAGIVLSLIGIIALSFLSA